MLKNKKIRTIFLLALILVSILGINYTQGMQNYQKLDFETGIVTASALNVRKGPSTSYDVITQIYKNEYIRIFAKIGDWYVIQTKKDYIGAVNSNYVRAIYQNADTKDNNTTNNITTSGLTNDEKETLDLINEQRIAARLARVNYRWRVTKYSKNKSTRYGRQ